MEHPRNAHRSAEAPRRQVSGTDARPTFIADTLGAGATPVTHRFELFVQDDDGDWSTESGTEARIVTVTVRPPNLLPVAHAGSDLVVASGATVTLDGSGSSDLDGHIKSWAWDRTGGTGTEVVLTNAETASPEFTAETLIAGVADVTHEFSLTVTDDDGAISTDTVMVTVESPNAAPVANAGPDQTVASGAIVTLDGSGSFDIDGGIKTYSWQQPVRNNYRINLRVRDNLLMPTFTAPVLEPGAPDERLAFILEVRDHEGLRSTDSVWITVEAPNVAPVAHAGQDLTVASGTVVTLDGSGSSDPDGDHPDGHIKSWKWVRTGGTGTEVDLTNATTARPEFTADTLIAGAADVTHEFSLTVTDHDDGTSTDTVMVTVESPNKAPIANAGRNLTVGSGTRVGLDGSASYDDDGYIASYDWKQTDEGTGNDVDLEFANTANPTIHGRYTGSG